MKIKEYVEKKKPSSNEPSYKLATQSLRPREYVNMNERLKTLKPEERCIEDIYRKGLDGTFRDVDMAVHLRRFEGFRMTQDVKNNQMVLSQSEAERQFVAMRREQYKTKLNETISNRIETDQNIKRIWRKDESDKRHRQLRDLQFELAVDKRQELLTKKTNYIHQQSQIHGIDDFEKNLKRNGIGADDGETLLEVNYEDPNAFLSRLQELASKDWPKDADIRDFKMHLKKRSKDIRAARQEKARRKRRILAEQSMSEQLERNSQSESTITSPEKLRKGDSDYDAIDDGYDDSSSSSEEGGEEESEQVRAFKLYRESCVRKQEELLSEFAERCRMAGEERDDRREALVAVQLQRKERVSPCGTCELV